MGFNRRQRWWSLGPPPPRRTVPLDIVEDSYRRDQATELGIPVRHIHTSWANRYSVLAPYLNQLDHPTTPGLTYLFHGCGHATGATVVQSFSRWGPSIRFSRARSYFSTGRAVYWSNSVEFALAWCFFSETGSWKLDEYNDKKPFRCLIFVSKLNLQGVELKSALLLIPVPQSPEDEDDLDEWCESNLNCAAQTMRIPPPKSHKSDWGLLGSRIPRSLHLVHQKADKIWLYAACDEIRSRAIAKAGIEIVQITFEPQANESAKL